MKTLLRSGTLALAGAFVVLAMLGAFGVYVINVAGEELNQGIRVVIVAGTLATIAVLVAIAGALAAIAAIRVLRVREDWLKDRADRRIKEREADVLVVTAQPGHQVFVREQNPQAVWFSKHLDARVRVNGVPSEETPIEATNWQMYNLVSRSPRLTSPSPTLALPDPGAPALSVPHLLHLEDVIDPDQVTINRLILGAGPGGQLVQGALKSLSHIGVAGTSRWGKSIFLQSLLYQLVLAQEDVEFYLSDIGGTSFVDFGLPYADSVMGTERLAREVVEVADHRKQLYEATGQGIRTLEVYNQVTGVHLPYILLAIDETTALMKQSPQLTKDLCELVLKAAKYGIFLCLSGQNWKAQNVDTTIRDQFSSRFQFKAMDSSQANILIKGSGADEIAVKGRAVAYLPEIGKIMLQAPLIEPETIRQVARRPVPHLLAGPEDAGGEPTPREQLICQRWQAGASLNQISKEINDGRTGGEYNKEIKAVLEKYGLQ